ncbi:FAD/NAD(P)-binding protein [Streptacidiphilus fuscans]|uniref:FAD/NAD(P)-binding protein n=1 Tax=Streptacidiphilus fuscans TaxID=2789292 RepID=A0A931B7A0_9ACTN|nr:FAD/NAD(P)-binding protein [Streptacidiphilus fuscans]MBF9069972.1 FAD/NAD(P)-binding protein [Streptacidiphilus fuscans]
MRRVSIAVVGVGPRATGLLDRIVANAPQLLPSAVDLTIHLIDPHPPGPGRVWRHDQSPLLRMNSMAEDVTMFTDAATVMDGPVRPGPSLAEWAAGPDARAVADPAVRAELEQLAPTDFATRRVQSAYLDWVFRRTTAALAPYATVRVHREAAVDVRGGPDEPQQVVLASGNTVTADLVVLTLGHLDARPESDEQRLTDFAGRHRLHYLPPAYSADLGAELDEIAPGEDVVLRGFGLAAVDLIVLLTEGRGGRYLPRTDGSLAYLPSGREPVLHAGSRRGVPYHAKTGYRLQGPPPPLPRFFGPDAVDLLLGGDGPLDFRAEVWPSVAKEIAYGHYHELFHGHPERTRMPWEEFLAAFTPLAWYAPATAALVGRAVPDPDDRIDFEALDRPLAGTSFASPDALRETLRRHIRNDLARRGDRAHSADLGAFYALLSVYGQLPRVAASGRLDATSLARDLDGWWHGFFSFLASGPPGHRLRELLALSDAGLLHFLGPDLRVEADEASGRFLAHSPALAGAVTTATTLVEARLPRATLRRTDSPLLRDLLARGEATEERRSGLMLTDPQSGAVVDDSGRPHPRRIALGAHTSARAVAAFARPRSNSPAFRQNDAAARALLLAVARLGPASVQAQPQVASF